MIELIHRYPIVIKVLLTLVTVAFIGTGGWMWKTGKEAEGDYAAKIKDETVSMKEYQDTLQRMQEFYSQTFQGKLPPDFMKKLDINKRALDSLVEKKLLLVAAKSEGVKVGDEDIARAITEGKSFQDESGKFSKDRYLSILKSNGMTPSSFENSMRDDLTVDKFRNMIKDSVYVTDNDLRDYYTKQMSSQGKPFSEEEFKAKHDELMRSVTSTLQEKALKSFVEGLKSTYKPVINQQLISQQAAS